MSSLLGPAALIGVTEASLAIVQMKKKAQKVVLTNGCFDILHAGHVAMFRFARMQGDCLFVAVNSDESIRMIKGPGRPINRLEHRLEVLRGVRYVDCLVVFGDDSVLETVRRLRPDVLVKGGDYRAEEVVGHEVVEGYGGKVLVAPLEKGVSTTDLAQRMQDVVWALEAERDSAQVYAETKRR